MTNKYNEPVVHIFPQENNHQEAVVLGNKEGLLLLKKWIEEALVSGGSGGVVMPNDRETYHLEVVCNDEPLDAPFWSNMKTPYADLDDSRPHAFGPEVYGKNVGHGLAHSEDIPRVEKEIQENERLAADLQNQLIERINQRKGE